MAEKKETNDNWTPKSYPIPEHWLYTDLETVFENLTLTGKKLAEKNYEASGKFPVVNQGATEVGGYSNDGNKLINLERPVIVFGDHTKCLKYINFSFIPGADGVKVLMPRNPIDPKYAFYACKSLRLPDRGYSRHYSFLKKCLFPIAPLNEQKRIVAKIEELFSELDNGIATLKTAREQLKVYRQAILKHAFEGKLTAKWREENADKLETPEQLLARIQQERDALYQLQLEKWKAAVKEWEAMGNEGKKPSKPRKFEQQGEFSQDSKLNLELPSSWVPICIGHVYSVYVGATPSRKEGSYWNGDINWVSSGEVAFCEIQETAEKITKLGYENTSTEIHPEGTVLLAMIGEGKTRGQAAILRVPAAHNQNTAAIRVSEVNLSSEYLYYFLQYQYEQTRRVGSGNNQKALNKHRVSSLQFPLCAMAEQIEVAARLAEKLSIIENIHHEISAALSMSETLRQSILKKAFSGKLVSQNPDDEPASELLARIKAEKEQQKQPTNKSATKNSRKK